MSRPEGCAWCAAVLALLQKPSPRLAARVALRLFLTPVRRKLNPADEAGMYAARQHFLRCANGDRIRVYEWGEGARTVLVLHGWGSHAARFTTMVSALTARGWRVLAPDAPGHGESHGSTSSLPQFIQALDAAVEQLGPVHACIGHSMGSLALSMRITDATRPPIPTLAQAVLISTPSGIPFLLESFEQLFGIDAATRIQCLELLAQRFGSTARQIHGAGRRHAYSTCRCCWCTTRPTMSCPASTAGRCCRAPASRPAAHHAGTGAQRPAARPVDDRGYRGFPRWA